MFKRILKTIIVVFLLEITIFNINFYRTIFEKSKEITVDNVDNNGCNVSIDNLNIKLKSIYLKLDNLSEKQVVDYDIFCSDDSTSLRYLGTKSYCQDVEKTKYTVVSLSRKL